MKLRWLCYSLAKSVHVANNLSVFGFRFLNVCPLMEQWVMITCWDVVVSVSVGLKIQNTNDGWNEDQVLEQPFVKSAKRMCSFSPWESVHFWATKAVEGNFCIGWCYTEISYKFVYLANPQPKWESFLGKGWEWCNFVILALYVNCGACSYGICNVTLPFKKHR